MTVYNRSSHRGLLVQRRWRIPPPPVFRPDMVLGLPILHEDSAATGAFLWRMLRAVDAWSATPARERNGLFGSRAATQRTADLIAVDPDPALERWARMLLEMVAAPELAEASRVGRACAGLAAWAATQERPAARVAFTHAAAMACPGSAVYALSSARAYRDAGVYADAETLYQRSVALARQCADWETYTRAHAGLGILAQYRGAWPMARKALLRALRSAERHSIRALRPLILHDLFTTEAERGAHAAAEQYAIDAAHHYGPAHPNLAPLASDVAIYWTRLGRFREALSVLCRVVPKLSDTGRLIALGKLARAAGAVNDREKWAWAVERIQNTPDESPAHRIALADVAHGAVSLGDWDVAEQTITALLPDAHGYGEHQLTYDLRLLQEQVQAHRAVHRKAAAAKTAGPAPAPAQPTALYTCIHRVLSEAGSGYSPDPM